MTKKTILAVIGTRPEFIKMAPVVKELLRHPDFDVRVCMSGQHRELVTSVRSVFAVPSHYNLELMTENQTLTGFAARLMQSLGDLVAEVKPDAVIAQGDTSTVFVTGLVSFYQRIPFFHVEAGLRSFDLDNPFPEEANRLLVSRVTRFHFAPTKIAMENLVREGISPAQIAVTGNTVVDALQQIRTLLPKNPPKSATRKILVTIHRRENFGTPLEEVCSALQDIIAAHRDVEIVLPVHPNPNVGAVVKASLGNISAIKLVEPLGYLELLSELQSCYLVLTDSGGIQEEAPSFGKPVLVMRKVTERVEGLRAGVSALVGTERAKIVGLVEQLLDKPDEYERMCPRESPFGDGHASARIVEKIRELLLAP